MNQGFKKRFKKLVFWLLFIFVILFFFRLAYGYTKSIDEVTTQAQFFDSISNSRKNYATKEYKQSNNSNQSEIRVDQKYEKVANIKTKSTNFDEEEKLTRSTIEKYNALIQFEQKSGKRWI